MERMPQLHEERQAVRVRSEGTPGPTVVLFGKGCISGSYTIITIRLACSDRPCLLYCTTSTTHMVQNYLEDVRLIRQDDLENVHVTEF